MPNILRKPFEYMNKYSEIVVAFGVVAIIGLIMLPVKGFILDLLLVMNITLGVVILLLTLFTTNVLQFSTFPTLLLVTTMFRLGLNISSTRLILSQGEAGAVIDAFANFVTGNNYIVGAIIFAIIVIVQMVVVTNGSSRVSEVSARFTLDAMPGKQMAIDADLNAGLITEEAAKERRQNLQREASFYGAMDGASKFVKGDAIAGIIITLINLLGGILIFSIKDGMSIMEALDRFGKLTIGDGLVSQVPALLISVASGILVTRSEGDDGFGKAVTDEIFNFSKVLLVASVVIFLIGLVPAFPTIIFTVVAVVVGSTGYILMEEEKVVEEKELRQKSEVEKKYMKQMEAKSEVITTLQVEPISVEIGYGLIGLVDESSEGNLPGHITGIRKQFASELGVVLNPIRIRDNLQLGPNDYVIKIKGNEVARGEIYTDRFLVIDPGSDEFDIQGIPTTEPSFGLNALWITEENRETVELKGYTIVEPITVLVTHLKEVARQYIYKLLGRQEVKSLIEGLKDEYSVVIDELIPDILTLGEVQKVLQNLLRENVPINDLVTILETLADNGAKIKDIELLTEFVRSALGRTIVGNYLNENKVLPVITIDPQVEELIRENTKKTNSGSVPILKSELIMAIFDNINMNINKLITEGVNPVIITSPNIRVSFRNLTYYNFRDLPILSLNEVPNDIEIETVGVLGQ